MEELNDGACLEMSRAISKLTDFMKSQNVITLQEHSIENIVT
jgi:hypothetical protein